MGDNNGLSSQVQMRAVMADNEEKILKQFQGN